MRHLTKRRAAVVAALVLAFLGVGVAYAYWTANGSGTGTAATASGSTSLVVNQTGAVTGLKPGGSAQTLSGTFTNTGSSAYVTTVTASIDSVTLATGHPAGTCDDTDYTLSGAVMTVNADVPAGTAVGSWTGATIVFDNKASDQDACQGAIVNLAYAIG